jgi:hypothetical protein
MPDQKYEREIVEILERLERQGQRVPPRRPRRPANFWFRRLTSSAEPWRAASYVWLGLGVGLPLLAALLPRPEWQGLASVLVLLGILVFISPLAMSVIGVARGEGRPLWRGRVIEMPYRGNGLAARWRYQLWVWRQRWERWRDRR